MIYDTWSSPCLEWCGCCITLSKHFFLVGIVDSWGRGERMCGMLLFVSLNYLVREE